MKFRDFEFRACYLKCIQFQRDSSHFINNYIYFQIFHLLLNLKFKSNIKFITFLQ